MTRSKASSIAATAQVERDARNRQQEQEREAVLHMLRERGYKDNIVDDVIDDREIKPLPTIPSKLVLSDAFLEHRAEYASKANTSADYLRGGPKPIQKKPSEKKLDPREVARRNQEAVQQRIKQLVQDTHVERAAVAWQATRSMNELGVFSPDINAFRARSSCHAEPLIRRTISAEQLRATAEHQLATGYVRPPPLTSESGEPIIQTIPELLRGRLEKLEGDIQRRLQRAGSSGGANTLERGSTGRGGSQRNLLGSSGSRRATVRCQRPPPAA